MGNIPIGRIAGFAVSVNWSVLVILWLFTWSLASTLPAAVPGYSKGAYWLAGACGALILLGSLLAHELTHAILARRAGVEVYGVTLWLFGGVTRLGGEAKTPKEAFRIAVSGPLMSLSLRRSSRVRLTDSARSGPHTSSSASPGGSRASTYCWACSICYPAPRWTEGGS